MLFFSSRESGSAAPSLAALFIIIPIAGVIAAAAWLAIAAAYENIRFAKTTDQILALAAAAHDVAAQDKNFGIQSGDILARLAETGKTSTLKDDSGNYSNIWRGAITATALPGGTIMRLETAIPTRDCRRLALFFGHDAKELTLQQMEAREDNGVWRQFYNVPDSTKINPTVVDAACGQAAWATLALVFRLR